MLWEALGTVVGTVGTAYLGTRIFAPWVLKDLAIYISKLTTMVPKGDRKLCYKMLWEALGTVVGTVGTAYLGMKIFAPWVLKDLAYLSKLAPIVSAGDKNKRNRIFFIDLFEETVKRCPKKEFVVFEQEVYTYEDADKRVNQVARAALEIGLQQGDVAAIMLTNEPDFVWTYLGLQKIGVQMAFINFNLKKKVLANSITISEAKLLFLSKDEDLQTAISEVLPSLDNIKVYTYGNSPRNKEFQTFCDLVDRSSTEQIDKQKRSRVRMSDTNVLIYTSGTTGLPKAAMVTHEKTMRGALTLRTFGMNESDILYEPLPLYHSAASILGVGNVAVLGATIVLKKKYSASQFLDDCRKHKVTILHYVGELCRYLVAQPKRDNDSDHCIRYAFGNGLRKDVWKELNERFKIPRVAEFYAATEMPTGFVNLNNKFGAVGRCSPLLNLILPVYFVKFDVENEEPVRDEKGFCIRSKVGEPGLLIIKIVKAKGLTFEGYKGRKEATEKKLLHDVFEKGDTYINSGDLLTCDKDYDIFFSDRVGDTFRWKGENVSTKEVADVVSDLDFLDDVCVYGVMVPGCEGRAGMASLCVKDNDSRLTESQLDSLSKHCAEFLPSYSRPRFLRVQPAIELTSTFKQRKLNLVTEGFDPAKVQSPLYYLNCRTGQYKELTQNDFLDINEGRLAL